MFRHSIVPSRRRGSVLARPRAMEPNSDRTYAWYRIVRVPSTNEIVAIQGQHGIKTHTNTLTPKSGRRVLNATVSTVRFVPFRPSRAPPGVRVLPRRRGYAHFTSAACDGRDGRRYRSDPVQEVGRCRLRAAGGLIRPPGVGSCPLRTCSSHGSSASILAAGASDAMVDRSYCNDRARYRSEGYAAADTGSSIDSSRDHYSRSTWFAALANKYRLPSGPSSAAPCVPMLPTTPAPAHPTQGALYLHIPCPNLSPSLSFTVHDSLDSRGFRGCSAFDCFGAGQHVSVDCPAAARGVMTRRLRR